MAWVTPKTDWNTDYPFSKFDFNRIEGDTEFLYQYVKNGGKGSDLSIQSNGSDSNTSHYIVMTNRIHSVGPLTGAVRGYDYLDSIATGWTPTDGDYIVVNNIDPTNYIWFKSLTSAKGVLPQTKRIRVGHVVNGFEPYTSIYINQPALFQYFDGFWNYIHKGNDNIH